ncbi:MAG: sensor histidine kinase [Proteobacteria bacterium]|nr:sensor histidine kinase [Pseudomonadota bacterium]
MNTAMNLFARFSLVRLLLTGGGVILLAGMTIIGTWVQHEIESGVISRAGAVTSLYVDSFVSPHLESLAGGGKMSDIDRSDLARVLSGTPFSREIVLIKIWAPDGTILFSSNPALVGRKFPLKDEEELASAFSGNVRSHITDLTYPENVAERTQWPQLIETYAPARAHNTGEIVAVVEFYQSTNDLTHEMRTARLRSWLMVGTATLIIFLLLAMLVKRASTTITVQQSELREKVVQLTALLAQNERLHERVQRAAERTTTLNERFLHRISADLHDGPAQGLALALMRMKSLADMCGTCTMTIGKNPSVVDEFGTLHSALQFALDDLRAIARGLHLPEIEQLSPAETAHRAVRDFERKTGIEVTLGIDGMPDEVPFPVKITLFRLLQESLANSFRHCGGADQRVTLKMQDHQLLVEISDSGKGFDPGAAVSDAHLGLAGLRERVEILGGIFSVQSALGKGTVVYAALPVDLLEENHE